MQIKSVIQSEEWPVLRSLANGKCITEDEILTISTWHIETELIDCFKQYGASAIVCHKR